MLSWPELQIVYMKDGQQQINKMQNENNNNNNNNITKAN